MVTESHTDGRFSWEDFAGEVEKDAAVKAVYDHVLSNPSIIGRLVQLASYWCPQTNVYEQGLAPEFQHSTVTEALRRLHEFVFLSWLGLSLERQKADVTVYLGGRGTTGSRLRQLRINCMNLVPAGAAEAERELFVDDLSIIETLLENKL